MKKNDDGFQIRMVDRHTVIYRDSDGEVFFEVESAVDGIILYTEPEKSNQHDKEQVFVAQKKVSEWLANKFKKVIEDSTDIPENVVLKYVPPKK